MADHDAIEANRNKPIDGADDGASGVGVLLELARQLQRERPDVGVDIIFFDAEDYGTPSGVDLPGDWWCLGSQYWAQNPHLPGYTAQYGILLDMVGAPDAKFFHEYFSAFYAQIHKWHFYIGYQNIGFKLVNHRKCNFTVCCFTCKGKACFFPVYFTADSFEYNWFIIN